MSRLSKAWQLMWLHRFGVYAFAVAAAYWPGMPDAGTQPRWMLVALAPLMLIGTKSKELRAAHIVGLAALGWAALSLGWTSNRYDGGGLLLQWMLLACVFVLGMRIEVRSCLIGYAWGIALSGIVAIVQTRYPIAVYIGDRPAGLFVNSDLMGNAAALGVAIAVIYRRWWLLPLLVSALVLAQSRAALIALGVMGLLWIWQNAPAPRRSAWLAAGVAMTLGAVAVLWLLKHPTDSIRVATLRDTIDGLTFLGHGLGSFQTSFAESAVYRDTLLHNPVWVHCDPLQLLYELGVGAVLVFVLFASALFARSEAAILMGGVLVESLLSFPLYVPSTAFLAALLLGHLHRDRALLSDRLDAWANILCQKLGRDRLEPRLSIWRQRAKGVSL